VATRERYVAGVDGTAADVLGPAEALAVLGDGLDLGAVGPLSGRPLLAVRLEPGPALTRLADLTPEVAGVVVGVPSGATAPGVEQAFDLVLPAGPGLDLVVGNVTRNPQAAAALVRTLRAGAHLPVWEALTVESFAYGLLQSGPEHRRWLETRAAGRARSAQGASAVRAERDGPVLTVTLDRPEVHNALDVAMRDALVEALAVAADPEVKEVHLRGAGPSFCSGGDLAEFGTAPDPATGDAVRVTRSPAAALARLAGRLTVHVHGTCVGAGVELAAFGERIVAAPGTTFRLPEVAMGLIPGSGGTVSLPRRIGRRRTAYLALSGETVAVDQALAWGLVDTIDDGPPR
jgi:hypothetical protein